MTEVFRRPRLFAAPAIGFALALGFLGTPAECFGSPKVALLALAHPDDETMIGGTLIKMKDLGFKIEAVYVTAGEGGKNLKMGPDGSPDHMTEIPTTKSELAKIRLKELSLAAPQYGIKKYVDLQEPDVPLRDPVTSVPTRDGVKFLEAKIWNVKKIKLAMTKIANEIHPDIVITMSKDQGTHGQHKAIRILTEELFNSKKLGGAQSLLAIEETRWVTTGDREPRPWRSVFDPKEKNPLGKAYALKASEAASYYQSQMEGHVGPCNGPEILYGVAGRPVDLTAADSNPSLSPISTPHR